MSEMLANQYFMARKYSRACELFEQEIRKDLSNKSMRSKLIICYIQERNVSKAWTLFVGLVSEDVDYIINMDSIRDDCPCPELVFELGTSAVSDQNVVDFYLISGMLWLFCDVEKSLYYLKSAQQLHPAVASLAEIITILDSYSDTCDRSKKSMNYYPG
jgi:hypothetical protein